MASNIYRLAILSALSLSVIAHPFPSTADSASTLASRYTDSYEPHAYPNVEDRIASREIPDAEAGLAKRRHFHGNRHGNRHGGGGNWQGGGRGKHGGGKKKCNKNKGDVDNDLGNGMANLNGGDDTATTLPAPADIGAGKDQNPASNNPLPIDPAAADLTETADANAVGTGSNIPPVTGTGDGKDIKPAGVTNSATDVGTDTKVGATPPGANTVPPANNRVPEVAPDVVGVDQ